MEHGEVVALLDITKCLYDAIARMERAAEKGSAIAAAVKGVEQLSQNGTGNCGPNGSSSLASEFSFCNWIFYILVCIKDMCRVQEALISISYEHLSMTLA